jgi:hypothetical protein
VLDQDGTLRKTQERPSRIAELGRADEHRAIDVMPLLGVWVDRRAAVDQGVEEGQWAGKLEPLGAELEHKERCVARGLDVDGDELRVVERRQRTQLGRIDRDLLPLHRLRRPARLEEDRPHDVRLSAVRTNCSSAGVTARTSTMATT